LLNGGGGIDYMVGLGGNDHYFVDNYGDYAVEADGEGDDWVSTSVSYTLVAGSSVETLNTTNASSADNIFLGGNSFAQSIYGNAGNNYIYGLGGNDYLVGLEGNDALNGGQGNDYLMGGPGSDVFHFDNNGSIDTIGDFDSSDYIDLGSFLGFLQFSFIGENAFSHAAGQGRFANGVFELDKNGDGVADLTVIVHGTVTATQFVFWDDFY
jgi:Ca2+-binding RTX toxin-like protein